jgi:crotonobetainyl-CoA:carnitine CoA-transferase CaiB-like acyl-CoA transferase
MSGPLTGLRVLDISTVIAAPFAATLLADYGAEVLKVEMPGSGDGARGFGPFKDGKPLWWKVINRGKDFVTLDLRKPEGAELLKRMLPEFDVLIENFRPGTLDGWGLSKEVLWAIQPRLVILRTTGFGQTGPYRDRPAFARVFEAMAGLTYITGEPDGEPMHAGYPLGDAMGGLFGAIGVLAALWKRASNKDVLGEEIDLSLTESILRVLEFLPIEYDQLGTVRQRSGNRSQYSAPSAVFRTSDGNWVTLAGSTPAIWINNCRAIEREDLIDDPRFSTNGQRTERADELNRIFSEWCARHTLDEVLTAFRATHGVIGPIYGIDQVFSDPQTIARSAIISVADDDFGTVRMQSVVPRFVNDPGSVRRAAGSVGRDNHRIYRERLGLSQSELQDLAERKII